MTQDGHEEDPIDATLPDPNLPPPADEPATWIDHLPGLRKFCEHLETQTLLAIDTEANSMHAYEEQTCIAQLTAGGRNAIIDVLAVKDLRPLRDVVARPDVEVVFHGGDYDITCLTRDFGFTFGRVFDTMIAATFLAEPRVGLGALVERAFGIELEKKFQRSDWGRRPLSEEQIDYLRHDTIFLHDLRTWLKARIRDADLEEELEIELRRLARRVGAPRTKDPEGWRRMKGANRLDDAGRCVLHALYGWREGVAQARNRPPFKVFSPSTMMKLAAKPPRKAHHPRTLPFVSHGERSRYGRQLVAAIQRGLEAHAAGDIPAGPKREALTPEQAKALKGTKQRELALKAWRRDRIAERTVEGRPVPGVVVLPNPAVALLAANPVESVEALAGMEDIGPKRAERYGEGILRVLREA